MARVVTVVQASSRFPLVSIIITTYNYAHMVRTAIESALNQDYSNLEILVLDNASTDDTPAVVEPYLSDPRLRYIRNETNIGMVPNHNKGVVEARGEYVLFLSADDFLLPNSLSHSWAFLAQNPAVDVLYTSAYFINAHGMFTGIRQMGGQPLVPYAGGRNEFASLLIEGCYMCFPTMLMRRELFERFGELALNLTASDYELVIRWASRGVRFAYLPEPTCAVRLHPGQASNGQNYIATGADAKEFIDFVIKYAAEFGELLRDFELSVSKSVRGRMELAKTYGFSDDDGSLNDAVLKAERLMLDVRARNRTLPRTVRLTVIVVPTSNVHQLERTLRSLIAQTRTDWEAIVLQDSGQSFEGLGDYLDGNHRIRTLRMLAQIGDAKLLNTGLRVAAGNAFIVLRAGNELPPEHFERVLEPLERGDAECVRTPTRLVVDVIGAPAVPFDGVFMPPTDFRLPWSVPLGPIESVVFTRSAIDQTGGTFNETLGAFVEWEFHFRLALSLRFAIVESSPVIRPISGTSQSFGYFSALPRVAATLYGAYPSNDPIVNAQRAAFLPLLKARLDLGVQAAQTPGDVATLFRVAGGLDLAQLAVAAAVPSE